MFVVCTDVHVRMHARAARECTRAHVYGCKACVHKIARPAHEHELARAHTLTRVCMHTAQVSQMEVFKPLSVGWAKGFIQYGAGLMVETATRTVPLPPTFTALGT